MDTEPSSSSNKRRYDELEPIEDESPDETWDGINPGDLTSFHCSTKLRDMHVDHLLTYFPQLPERTQYFDMGILRDARLNHADYYFDKLVIWRDVSTLSTLSNP